LKNRLLLLTGGSRNLPTRQQTLRNTIAWSYELLNINEKRLFALLSVFIGGCTLEAVEDVCQADSNKNVSVLDGLEALVDKSLLRQEEVDHGARFVMLETIHEFASEKLLESGDAEQIRRRHANFFLKQAEAARPFLEKADQAIWLELLERELANLRAALSWTKEDEQIKLDAQLAEALCIFWFMRGHLVEGRIRLTELMSLPGVLSDKPLHASLLNQAGFLARYQGDYEGAYSLISESLAICREQGDRQVTADVMANLGYVVLHQANYEQARALYAETLAIYRELNNGQGIADSLSHLALLAFYQGDDETALRYDEESLMIWRKLEDKQGVAWALHRLGNVLFHQGDHRAAANLYRESLSIANGLSFKWGVAFALEGLACIAVAQGKTERGLCLAGAATALRQKISIPLPPAGVAIFENSLAPAWQALSTESASAAWAKGQTMELSEIVDYALEAKGCEITDRG
jgi:tetratricopeptide (TPR) repeat protein